MNSEFLFFPLILSPVTIIELRPLVMHYMEKQTLLSLFTFAFNYLCRYVFPGSSAQPQYLLSTSGHIHPTPPSTTLHNALICLQERTSYRNIASQNINTRVPRPQGENGTDTEVWKELTLGHEKCTSHVRHRSSLTAKTLFVELQAWIIYNQKAARNRREEDRGVVETSNGGGNMGWKGLLMKEYIQTKNMYRSATKQKTLRRLTTEKRN